MTAHRRDEGPARALQGRAHRACAQRRRLHAEAGEVLGVLGESGSGKSVTLRALLRMLPPRRSEISGAIRVGGEDVLALDAGRARENARRRRVDDLPGADAGARSGLHHRRPDRRDGHAPSRRHLGGRAQARARDARRRAHPFAKRRLENYPHEMSGGMRQRAMIALALSCKPKVLLADEPTTALDATVQIQILLLLRELQREMGMAVIFVTHDIGVAVEISDRIAVMYGGRIVETGVLRDVVRAPKHPYTRGLLVLDHSRRAARQAAGSDPGRAAAARPPAGRLHLRAALLHRGPGVPAGRDPARDARCHARRTLHQGHWCNRRGERRLAGVPKSDANSALRAAPCVPAMTDICARALRAWKRAGTVSPDGEHSAGGNRAAHQTARRRSRRHRRLV